MIREAMTERRWSVMSPLEQVEHLRSALDQARMALADLGVSCDMSEVTMRRKAVRVYSDVSLMLPESLR